MSLINFSNVTKYYSLDLILDHVTFNINKGERVALVGNNGTGKTTLLKLILKEEEPTLVAKEDKVGDISILNGTSIGYLNQDAIKDINNTVKEELMLVFAKNLAELNYFYKLSDKISTNHSDELLEKYNELLEKLTADGTFNLDNKIEGYITKFHFPKEILNTKISTLSGGERMKIAFIKLLLGDYDLLLLDEPTNHLDISTIEWLEEYLKSYKGTILFISHDRYFLETLATKILDLENHKITTYNLGYDDYLKEKELRYQQELAKYEREEEEMERLRRFIEFYMPKPRFASRAKDRVHKLEKLEANHIDKPQKENRNIKFKIEGSNLKNKGLLDFKDVVAGYDVGLFPPFNFTLYGKDRLAIVGDNGIGKTTLIKSITLQKPLIFGKIQELRPLKIGYIKQNDYEFVSKLTCLDYLREKYPKKLDSELRTALGRFLFTKEDVFKNCSLLSNGEKMRLVLCDLSLSEYDVLILDEPTNHLDMVTKECLLTTLKNYEGAIIFISHDRYFINSLADYILYLSRDLSLVVEGNYEDIKEKIGITNKTEEEKEAKKVKELVYDKIETKPKLSNNKIKEYKDKLLDIEKRLEEINDLLNMDFENYKEIDALTDERSELEEKYFEILNILDEN
ncbi:MAG: ABC-F family ATP-binding cassette domain-containing protein [Bacilli bacterium]|nr:ABC-F family ATP-binding cassette domain-containing protein [Bacilli bacterium]